MTDRVEGREGTVLWTDIGDDEDIDVDYFLNRLKFLKMSLSAAMTLCGEFCKERDEARAAVKMLVQKVRDGASYLDDLHDNIVRNDADMQLDRCGSPRHQATRMRAALTDPIVQKVITEEEGHD